ncbi:MAG: dihydrolipoamide acetyltransferase family protein [Chitinophagales bacterium]
MPQIELIMPKMGESIMEATILKWLKKEGDPIEEEESVLEIATDKVDSEVPSPVEGVLSKILFQEGDVVPVGTAIALIATKGEATDTGTIAHSESNESSQSPSVASGNGSSTIEEVTANFMQTDSTSSNVQNNNGFYSPLVLNMAKEEGISMEELSRIKGTGKEHRLTKKDMKAYIVSRAKVVKQVQRAAPVVAKVIKKVSAAAITPPPKKANYEGQNVEIVEMDRMRRLIADHMVRSVQTSPHVTSFVEVDVTNLVRWRNKVKNDFAKREGEKLTFTPLFVEVVVKALKAFPWVNASVDGYNVVVKKDFNVGMAAATPSGNLIVPVIKHADRMNLVGLAKTVNDLANRARNKKLKPTEINGGTFTISNIGSFGSLMGTPIINQPQVAIMAIGSIRKKPAVLETEYGDVIAVRHMMMLSLSYDHRIVDGAMGSSFLQHIAKGLASWDVNRMV